MEWRLKNRQTQWSSVLALCLILTAGQVLSIVDPLVFPGSQVVDRLRLTHIVLIGLTILLIFIGKSKAWLTENFLSVLFCVVMIPTGIITGFYHHYVSASELSWYPLPGFKMYFLMLGILMSGSYRLNFILMCLFGLEAMTIWVGLDLFDRPGVLVGQEPWVTFMYFIVAITLLTFRYRDGILIQKLSVEKANTAAIQQMARVFLTLRDRSNTPLQTLQTSAELLKLKDPNLAGISEKIIKTTERLVEINRYLDQMESAIPWGKKELLSDDEILDWVKTAPHGPKTAKN